MKKITILISLFVLSGCVSADLERGIRHIEPTNFNYDERARQMTIRLINNDQIYLRFFQRTCGGYGLVGIVVPIIPVWDNIDCKNFEVEVSVADQVLVTYQNKIYKPTSFDPKYRNYTFPLDTKSLSDGATLIIEKNGQKFEIPFRYQHTFSFQLWGT